MNDCCNNVKECINKIEKEVYVKEDILIKIVSLLCRIKEGTFPSSKLPRGIIFYGSPGTGKTLLMRTLTKVMEVPFVYVRGPEIMSQYYGKTEENIRRKFKKAESDAEEHKLAIIYIDELDSIAPNRMEVSGELEQRLVGQLLTLMDGLSSSDKGHVIVIGSTNRIESIDPALRRPGRFDYEFEFEIPSEEERIKILKILALKNKIDLVDNDYKDIARITPGFTGADLQHLVNEAILNAIIQNKKAVSKEDIINALDRVIPSGLREYVILDPKESKDKKIKEKVNKIFDLIPKDKISGEINDFKIIEIVGEDERALECVQAIANKFKKEFNLRYHVINVNPLSFITKWYGETEKRVYDFFNKIKKQAPAIVYIGSFHIITSKKDEKLERTRYAILNQLMDMKITKKKVLLIISYPQGKDKEIDDSIKSFISKIKITIDLSTVP